MNYDLYTLKNGVRVIAVPVPSLESATVTVWVGVGSRYESEKTSGLSHFLEHIVFKGSKKRPSAKQIAQAIDSIGGEFNASTSKEWTNFYIKARSQNIETAFDVLSDMVLNPLLKKEDIEREKGVITEEIGMYEDTPMLKISDLFENLIFKGSELEKDIVGTRESVNKMKRDDFVLYRKSHYGSNNIVITVAGSVKPENIRKLSEKYFSNLKAKTKKQIKTFKKVNEKDRVLISNKQKEQAHLVLGVISSKRGSKDRFAEELLATILGRGMSSRLFTEVREKRGLAYAVRASGEKFMDTGILEIYAGVDPKRAKEAIGVILNECYSIANNKKPISKNELKKAKEFIKGRVALSLEDTKAINSYFGLKKLLLNKIETPKQMFDSIDKVSDADIVKVAGNLFKPDSFFMSIIGPYKNKKDFEDLIK